MTSAAARCALAPRYSRIELEICMSEQKRLYAGADWVRAAFKCEPSPLGVAVADLLGDVEKGIYHASTGGLSKVDWANPDYIAVPLTHDLATFDRDELTRLVVLCHDRCLRLEIAAAGRRQLKLGFSPRQREGSTYERHPTIEAAVASIRADYAVPEG